MELDEIKDMWKADAEEFKDSTDLDKNAMYIPMLHHKYYTEYSNERLRHQRLTRQYKELYLQIYDFYHDGPSEETVAKGWKLPAKGKISAKVELPRYLDADPFLNDLKDKLEYTKIKMEYLENCIKIIHAINFKLRLALDFMMYTGSGRK